MIDVMMFLLIFFVLISLNVIPAFGLKTTLPDSKTASRATVDEAPIVVSLQADGSVALDGQLLASEQLGGAAKAAHQKDPKKRFIVSADQTVQWKGVVAAMDALREQGIESITFATKRVQ
ncbi:biopolymer transporter ExbD [Uliginosibacterium sp. IMCC34675]|uniref:Biopolymer transporter ExbD n=2 Tax=Zoogloeaceae TaxID=2008794 RepID=A0ABX2IPX0_9RHOO|nr:biopolymer transporter ExbD [Uliginosibacterium aquaticum]